MRLIDADALIAEYPDDVLTHCDIEAAPTIDLENLQPQWIPVTERLPESSQDVLITRRRTRGTVRVMKAFYMPSDNGGIWASQCGICTTGVIAWMPMPEPYKPEKIEDNDD